MLRLLALAMSLAFFWGGGPWGAEDVALLAGGAFFMILFLGTFLQPAHAVMALGGALCAMAAMSLGMGEISLSRYNLGPAKIEDAPLSFWIQVALLLGCGMALLIGGIARARKAQTRAKGSESHTNGSS